MRCVRCLVAYQAREQDSTLEAEYVYKGESLCHRHINVVRGLDENFNRYPKPFAREWAIHNQEVHNLQVYIGDNETEHQELYPECEWVPDTSRGFSPSRSLEDNKRRQKLFSYAVEDARTRLTVAIKRLTEATRTRDEAEADLDGITKTLELLKDEEARLAE